MGINIFSKTIKAAIIVITLTFSTNTHAATSLPLTWDFFNWNWPSWDWPWGGNNDDYWGNDDDWGWGDDDNWCNNDQGGGNTSVPLDGGLSILLIGAAAFGVKKLRGNKNDEI